LCGSVVVLAPGFVRFIITFLRALFFTLCFFAGLLFIEGLFVLCLILRRACLFGKMLAFRIRGILFFGDFTIIAVFCFIITIFFALYEANLLFYLQLYLSFSLIIIP
jgi:hypothetical protein